MENENEIKWKPTNKVEELFNSTSGNKWASINRPTAGSREEKILPVGNSSFQLYSLSTPNGQKPGILLEELGIEYDAHSIFISLLFLTFYSLLYLFPSHSFSPFSFTQFFNYCLEIMLDGQQFTSGFVEVNPNSKIPAAVDKDGPNGVSVNLFESASILLYLAEKYQRFIPTNPALKAEVINWLFWQVGGQGPITGACFGHFFVYAPGYFNF